MKLELNLWTRTILTRGSEFLMAWTSRSRTWATRRTTTSRRLLVHEVQKFMSKMDEPAPNQQGERQQRAGNFCDEVGRIRVDHECTCFCEPIKGSSKTTKTYSCLLIYKNCTCQWKILDWYWARNLFVYRLPSVKTTDYSSSSWSSTSRRRWSDWILEIKRVSSESFENSQHRSDDMRKSKMAAGGGNKKRFPNSSRSFRTQSHFYFITEQCFNSGRFLRVHLSSWMCSQCALHHKFRIDSGRTKI